MNDWILVVFWHSRSLTPVCCRCKLPIRVMLCPLVTVSCARRSQKPNCSKVSDCQMLQTGKSHPPVCSVPKCIWVCTWFWKNIPIIKWCVIRQATWTVQSTAVYACNISSSREGVLSEWTTDETAQGTDVRHSAWNFSVSQVQQCGTGAHSPST